MVSGCTSNDCIVEATRPTPDGPFNFAIILTELAVTGDNVAAPWISDDQLRLYYCEKIVDDYFMIKMAQRPAIGDSWTPTKTFEELHTGDYGGLECSLTPDELTIFFQSKRPGSVTDDHTNLWMATRPSTDDPFTDLTPLDEINSTLSDHSPYIMPDGLTLYFTSSRTPLEGIYKANRTSTSELFGNVERLSVSTDIYREFTPHVTTDEQTIYFYSDRGAESDGIWVSNLEPNPEGDPAQSPCLSGDGLRMYFHRYIPALGHNCIVEAARPTSTGLFTSEIIRTELAVTGDNVSAPWISDDQLRLYYSEKVDGYFMIKMAQRPAIGDSWTPTKIFDELHPGDYGGMKCSLTPDELTIFFQSKRPGSVTDDYSNLWMATRPSTDDPFTDLTPLDEINSTVYDHSPYIMPDGLTLYFTSNRTLLEGIYKATRTSTNEPFGNVERLSVSTIIYREFTPYVTADEKTIYFYSNRDAEGNGIWVSHWIGSSYDIALNSIRAAIADKTAAIDKITEAIGKELIAIRALNDKPSELTNKAIRQAKIRLLSSIRWQIKARIDLRRGLRELEQVFKDITNPSAANNGPPHHPHRQPVPKPMTGPTLRPRQIPTGIRPRR